MVLGVFSQWLLYLHKHLLVLTLLPIPHLLLISQVNMASSVWRTWFTRSTRLVRASELPTTSCCLSSCRLLVTLPGIRLGCWRTLETLDFATQTLTPSSDNWTEEELMKDGHSAAFIRMLYSKEQMPAIFLWQGLMGLPQSYLMYIYVYTHSSGYNYGQEWSFLTSVWKTSCGAPDDRLTEAVGSLVKV